VHAAREPATIRIANAVRTEKLNDNFIVLLADRIAEDI